MNAAESPLAIANTMGVIVLLMTAKLSRFSSV